MALPFGSVVHSTEELNEAQMLISKAKLLVDMAKSSGHTITLADALPVAAGKTEDQIEGLNNPQVISCVGVLFRAIFPTVLRRFGVKAATILTLGKLFNGK